MLEMLQHAPVRQAIAYKLLGSPCTPIPYPVLHPNKDLADSLNAVQTAIPNLRQDLGPQYKILRIRDIRTCSTHQDIDYQLAMPCYALFNSEQINEGEYFSLNWGDRYYPDINIEDEELIDLVDFLHMVRIGDRTVQTRIGGVTEQLFFKALVARYPGVVLHEDFAMIHEPNVRAGLSPAKLIAYQKISDQLEEYYSMTDRMFYIERSGFRGSSWRLVKATT